MEVGRDLSTTHIFIFLDICFEAVLIPTFLFLIYTAHVKEVGMLVLYFNPYTGIPLLFSH